MKSFAIAAGLLALSSSVIAQLTNQSRPFTLTILTDDETYNGTFLNPCHEGAAIESLCVYQFSSGPQHYNLNYTTSSSSLEQPGLITFNLPVVNMNVPSALGIFYNPTSNVAVPLFFPDAAEGQIFSFSSSGLLGVPQSLDDTVVPAKPVDNLITNRWYICDTNAGYNQETLALVLGAGEPENPSCVSANILRTFA